MAGRGIGKSQRGLRSGAGGLRSMAVASTMCACGDQWSCSAPTSSGPQGVGRRALEAGRPAGKQLIVHPHTRVKCPVFFSGRAENQRRAGRRAGRPAPAAQPAARAVRVSLARQRKRAATSTAARYFWTVWNRDINACDSLIVVNTGSGAGRSFCSAFHGARW